MYKDDTLMCELSVDGQLVYTSESIQGQLNSIHQDCEETVNELYNLQKDFNIAVNDIINNLMYSIECRTKKIKEYINHELETNNIKEN